MKTLKKFMVMMVAGIMAFGSYLAYPLTKIVAYVNAQTNNQVVKVVKVPSSLNLKEADSVTIPFDETYFENVNSGVKTVRVYNGMNRVEAEYNAESTSYIFAPKSTGIYHIVYGTVENDTFNRISKDYTLVVTGDTTTFSFTENSEYYLPAKVPAKNGQKVYIPYPTVVLADGTKLNYGDEKYNVTIRVTSKDGNVALENGEGHQHFTLQDDSTLGIYEVRYNYNDDILIKNFEVVNKENFDTSKLSYTATITDWNNNTQRYKGEEITLPTVTVKDSSSNDVTNQTFNKITVEYYVNGTVQANTDNSAFELKGNKLIVKQDAKTDNTAYYQIKYNVTDYFGNVIKKDYTFSINNVSAYRDAPTVYAVRGYEEDADTDTIVNMSSVIPTKFNYVADEKDTITIPAIYAEDYYGSEFVYTRSIKHQNDSEATIINVEANKTTTYQITKTGEYKVSFKAKSKLTGLEKELEFSIKVLDGTNENEKVTSKPEIKLPEIPAVINAGETVEIALPTISDKEESGAIVDETVTVTVEGLEEVIQNHFVVGYKLTAPENVQTVTVKITAVNDNGATTTEEKVVKVIANDANPADVEVVTASAVDESSIVTLPTVKFEDENTDYLDISVVIYDPNGKLVKSVEDIVIKDGQVSGGHFTAGLEGDYKIIYTAIDTYSNATSMLVVIEGVAGTTGYIQSGISGTFPTQAQPNETVTLPEAVIQKNGKVVNDVEYKIVVMKSAGSYQFNQGTRKFTASEEGIYEFAYFYGDEQLSEVYTLKVSDTVNPELNVGKSRITATVLEFDEENPQAITIPAFKPSDANGLSDYGFNVTRDGSKVSKYSYDSEKLLETFYADNNDPQTYSFTPDTEGVYVVEYYAIDNSGNKTTYKLDSFNVGDVDTPKLTINADIPTTVDKGETVSFKKSDIVVEDSSTKSSYTIKVVGPESKEVANTGADGDYAYKFETSGEYTMTITADDGHGHTSNEVKTITVTTEDYKAKINTDVIGIIITVISLLILAGVIFYFIKTRDKKGKKKLIENKDTENKD